MAVRVGGIAIFEPAVQGGDEILTSVRRKSALPAIARFVANIIGTGDAEMNDAGLNRSLAILAFLASAIVLCMVAGFVATGFS